MQLRSQIVTLVRTLRAAGLPLGVGAQLDALASVSAAGINRRGDLYWALHAALVSSPDHTPVFQRAFQILFANLAVPEPAQVLPGSKLGATVERPAPGARRIDQALLQAEQQTQGSLELLAQGAASAQERLQHLDFEQMSVVELDQAKALLRTTSLVFKAELTRRYFVSSGRGPVDFPATLRHSLRTLGEPIRLSRRSRRRRPPTLVLLCDISASMGRYSRMFLHFAHAVTNARDRVHTLVFGTRLSNITRSLGRRDVDAALDRVSDEVLDWHGGTRIGDCVKAFNRDWSRRLLGQGATVILLSDGLETDSQANLAFEARRLALSARRLIWLNPLLRYEAFQPRASGVRQLLPHVDDFRAAHNVESLLDLAKMLV